MKYPVRFWFTSSLLVVLLLAACSTPAPSSPGTGHAVTVVPSTSTSLTANGGTEVPGASGCHPASPIILPPAPGTPVAGVALPQVQGKAPGGQLWALIFYAWPIQARQADKIVWRMTGSGNLQLVAYGPGDQVVRPTDFIAHEGSSWDRPGLEWGSTFTFPVSGCWDVHATMPDLSGDVWFLVV